MKQRVQAQNLATMEMLSFLKMAERRFKSANEETIFRHAVRAEFLLKEESQEVGQRA